MEFQKDEPSRCVRRYIVLDRTRDQAGQYHTRAQQCSQRIAGKITTTVPILIETANALSRIAWRSSAVALIDHVLQRADVEIVALTQALWERSWELYRTRLDKEWSLTDCASFQVMHSSNLIDALSADEHFRQAGFRPVLLEGG